MFQPTVEDVVESKPSVHYLIDLDDSSAVDQTDR